MGKLLIVDEDIKTLEQLLGAFHLVGHEAVICDRGSAAIDKLRSQRFDVIVCDIMTQGNDWPAFMDEVRNLGMLSRAIVTSDHANLEMAVNAVRLGAAGFAEQPLSFQKLLITVENILRLSRLEDENHRLRQYVGKQELVWQSSAMEKVIARLTRIASSETRLCIHGEPGTEKDLIARTIHDLSPRRHRPFLSLNCGSIPAGFAESDLFGNERGLTGAGSMFQRGRMEEAHGGTLFLDEVGELSPGAQARLLRFLKTGNLERTCGTESILVDVRVIFGTDSNLEDLVKRRIFLQDLYHYVFAFTLTVPPLRERSEDIPILTDYFASMISRQNDWKPKVISAEAYSELQRYPWPGNIRELRNVVERLLILAKKEIDAATVRHALGVETGCFPNPFSAMVGPLFQQVEAFEREVIFAELKRNDFRMSATARALGLERSHLYKKCQHLGIDHKSRAYSKPFTEQNTIGSD